MKHSDLSTIFIFLLLLVSYHHHYCTAEAPPEKQPLFPYRSPTTLLNVPSVGVFIGVGIATILLVFILLLFLRCCLLSESPKCESAIGIDPQLLETFPILLYSSIMKHVKEGDEGPLPCAVCLSDFNDNDTVRVLPQCNHYFHPPCVDVWLSTHVTCPVCRSNLNCGGGIENV
ncbi:unnamed protein product [Lathyrus sativus]|nr:unnamed protein product [Lathyrus sativus]